MEWVLGVFGRIGRVVATFALLATADPTRADGPPGPTDVVIRGKASTLAAAVRSHAPAASFDAGAEPAKGQAVVVDDRGEVVPLLLDDASRALFLDDRLRDVPLEMKARRFPGLPYVQVVSFRIERDGAMRIPEYYCIICSISVRFPQTCPCCQAEMELRMKPESP